MDNNIEKTLHSQYGFDRQDRDLLIRLNTRVEDLITSLDKKDHLLAQDIGGLKEGKLDKDLFMSHCTEDKKDLEVTKDNFKAVWLKSDEHTTDIKSLNKYLWIGIGILTAIQFIYPFVLKKYV